MRARANDTATHPGGARWRWFAGLLCASLAVVVVDLLANVGESPFVITPQVVVAFNVYQVIGVAFALRASRDRRLDRRGRLAWAVMVVAYVLLAAAGVLRSVFPETVFPNPADVLRLAFVPVSLLGLLVLPMRDQDSRERHKVWLDTVVVVVASAMVFWFVQIEPGVTQTARVSHVALVAALAYPVFDLVLIFGASVVLFRGAADSARRPAGLLGAAMLVIVVGDVYLGYRQSHSQGYLPDRWQYACWLTGSFLFAMAALVQCRLAGQNSGVIEEQRVRSISVLPYLAIGLSYVLLVLTIYGQSLRVLGMVTGAVVITAVVVARQIIALRQNHDLAVTDPLTGLVNRRQVHDRLRLALSRGARNGRHVAAMVIDLNEFKLVNDTMGHESGDQLLVALGQILRRNVLGRDVVGRLGGDEFAVVLPDIGTADDAMAVARRIVEDMAQPIMIGNTLIQPRAAIGVAVSKPGELTSDELLHHADLAMYRSKGNSPTTAAGLHSTRHRGPSLTVDETACAKSPGGH